MKRLVLALVVCTSLVGLGTLATAQQPGPAHGVALVPVAPAPASAPVSTLPGAGLLEPGAVTVDAGPVVPISPTISAGTAPASVVPYDPSANPSGFFSSLWSSIKGGQWRLIAMLVLVGLVWLARTIGGKLVPWLKTDRGGALLAILAGILGALASLAIAGAKFTPQVLIDGVMAGFTAAGGWTVAKKILYPADSATTPPSTPKASA